MLIMLPLNTLKGREAKNSLCIYTPPELEQQPLLSPVQPLLSVLPRLRDARLFLPVSP